MGKISFHIFIIIASVFCFNPGLASEKTRQASLIITVQNSLLTKDLLISRASKILNEEGIEVENSINYKTPEECYLTLRIDVDSSKIKISATFSSIGGNYTGTTLYPELAGSIKDEDDIGEMLKEYIDKNLK